MVHGTWTGVLRSFEKRGSHRKSYKQSQKRRQPRPNQTTPDLAQRGSMENGMRVNNEALLHTCARVCVCVRVWTEMVRASVLLLTRKLRTQAARPEDYRIASLLQHSSRQVLALVRGEI